MLRDALHQEGRDMGLCGSSQRIPTLTGTQKPKGIPFCTSEQAALSSKLQGFKLKMG